MNAQGEPIAPELEPRHLQTVIEILSREAPGLEVLAYGSRVTGRAQECSDLDLALRDPVEPMRNTARAAEVREAFVVSLLPFSVDVCEWALIPDSFRQEISSRHIRLQGP